MAYCLSHYSHIYLPPSLNTSDISTFCSHICKSVITLLCVKHDADALCIQAFSYFKWSFAYRHTTPLLISPFISTGLLIDSTWASCYHFCFIFPVCLTPALIEIFRASSRSVQTWTDGTGTYSYAMISNFLISDKHYFQHLPISQFTVTHWQLKTSPCFLDAYMYLLVLCGSSDNITSIENVYRVENNYGFKWGKNLKRTCYLVVT